MEEKLLEIANQIDHTILKADATRDRILEVCQECKTNHFKMIAINSCQSELCYEALRGSGVHVGAAISFPLGQTDLEVKLFETKVAIEKGVDEIDYVVNLTDLKSGNWQNVEWEMKQMTLLCHQMGKICKVIFETCYLTNQEIEKLCAIALKVRPDFIKTSTGFATAGATIQHVTLMKACVGDAVQVKASGGIRDLDTLLAMKKAGATRFGTSNGVNILKEAAQRLATGTL